MKNLLTKLTKRKSHRLDESLSWIGLYKSIYDEYPEWFKEKVKQFYSTLRVDKHGQIQSK